MTSLAALLLSAGLPLAVLSAVPVTQPPHPSGAEFGEEIDVRLFTVVVRVVDGAGRPIEGLSPADFRLRVGKHEVPVTAADWHSSAKPEGLAPESAAVPAAAASVPSIAASAPSLSSLSSLPSASASPSAAAFAPSFSSLPSASASPSAAGSVTSFPGKLVVVFVEADNNEPGRVRGLLRLLLFTREFLAALQPEDRVAVVSFDSHLKLWQDFTREREPVHAAIYQAIHFGGSPPTRSALQRRGPASPATDPTSPATDPVLLAAHFDLDKAADAASPERALEVTAEALAPLPGEKVLVFLGWGLGCFSSFGTQMTPAFAPAVRALKAARATVFVLDVTEAAGHDLEVGLQAVAEATGGTYDKTFLFPGLAVAQLARTISGYYVLSVDPAALPQRGGPVSVELRQRQGTVLLRPVSFGR